MTRPTQNRLPYSTFFIAALWAAVGLATVVSITLPYRSADLIPEGIVALQGSMVVAGWLLVTLWLTLSARDPNPHSVSGAPDTGTTEPDWSDTRAEVSLTEDRLFRAALFTAAVASVVLPAWASPSLRVPIAAAVAWATAASAVCVLYRQLTGATIRYRPTATPQAYDSQSRSFGIRGLMGITLWIAGAASVARWMAGGDTGVLLLPTLLGLVGGIVWHATVLWLIGRRSIFVPAVIFFWAAEIGAAAFLLVGRDTIDDSVGPFAVAAFSGTHLFSALYLAVMRAAGYRIVRPS